MHQLLEGVYIFPFQFGFMNMYLIETDDGYMFIDTGMSDSMIQQALDQMAEYGMSLADIKYAFITHGHYDHVGGLAYLQKKFNVRTYAHQRETTIIRGEKPAIFASDNSLGFFGRIIKRSMMERVHATPARVDTELKEGDEVFGDYTVIELPGHSYGQIGLWSASKRLLIGGDVAVRFPWGLKPPFSVATPDMPSAKASIKKAADLKPDVLCIGHGKPIMHDAWQALERLSTQFEA